MVCRPLVVCPNTPAKDLSGVKAHIGFQRAYSVIRDMILQQLRREIDKVRGCNIYAKRQKRKNKSTNVSVSSMKPKEDIDPVILITGHSMGGALATIAAIDIAYTLPEIRHRIRVYTFGCPRVGNIRFGKLFDSVFSGKSRSGGGHSFRVVFERDAVTAGPTFFMYRHVNQLVNCDRHGNLLVDPSPVEKLFFTSFKSSLSDHSLQKYEMALTMSLARQRFGGEDEEFNDFIKEINSENLGTVKYKVYNALLLRSDSFHKQDDEDEQDDEVDSKN